MSPQRAPLVFFFFALFYIMTGSFREEVLAPDEEYMLHVTAALVTDRPLYLPDNIPRYDAVTRTGKDGRPYSIYQIGQSLVYAPFYFVARNALEFAQPYDSVRFGNHDRYATWLERQTRRYLLLCPALFAALSCAVFSLFAGGLGFSAPASLILTLVYGLGTMVWPYSRFLLTESMQNGLLLLLVYLLFTQKKGGSAKGRTMALAGAAFGVLVSIRASLGVVILPLAVYWFYDNRDRRKLVPAALFGLPAFLFVFPQLIYDQVRFGGIFTTGYSVAQFTTPFWVGLYGLLFSAGKSVFLYSPVTLSLFVSARRFWRRARPEAILFFGISAILIAKYSGWWVWSGNPGWGPRYLLVITPFLLLPCGELVERVLASRAWWRRGFFAAIVATSVFVQLLAISVHFLVYLNYVGRAASLIPPSRLTVSRTNPAAALPIRDRYIETEFNPEYSPILGQWWLIRLMVTGNTNPTKIAPWAGLGFSDLHVDVPLAIKWDIWAVNLFLFGFKWVNVKWFLGLLALFTIWTIVGQELLFSNFGSRRDE